MFAIALSPQCATKYTMMDDAVQLDKVQEKVEALFCPQHLTGFLRYELEHGGGSIPLEMVTECLGMTTTPDNLFRALKASQMVTVSDDGQRIGPALLGQLRYQVEHYFDFSPQNIGRNKWMVTKLLEFGGAIPMEVMCEFRRVREISAMAVGELHLAHDSAPPADPDVVCRALQGSSVVTVSEDGYWIRPTASLFEALLPPKKAAATKKKSAPGSKKNAPAKKRPDPTKKTSTPIKTKPAPSRANNGDTPRKRQAGKKTGEGSSQKQPYKKHRNGKWKARNGPTTTPQKDEESTTTPKGKPAHSKKRWNRNGNKKFASGYKKSQWGK